jgi:4-hydroxy-3-polyprenylbenzoate decarboxylase
MPPNRVVLGISGASGSIYAKTFFEFLVERKVEIHLVISPQAEDIWKKETSLGLDFFDRSGVVRYDRNDFSAAISSGSFPTRGMAVIPASMGAIGRIAAGTTLDLISRAADVTLKERRPLVLVPRETPYSRIHLRNMLTLTEAGAIILPASPGFYQHPKTIQDLVNFVVARVLDRLGLDQDLMSPYTG